MCAGNWESWFQGSRHRALALWVYRKRHVVNGEYHRHRAAYRAGVARREQYVSLEPFKDAWQDQLFPSPCVRLANLKSTFSATAARKEPIWMRAPKEIQIERCNKVIPIIGYGQFRSPCFSLHGP